MRILAFVGKLERRRSGDITLGGASSFVVLPSLNALHSVVSCPLFLVVSAYFPVARPPYSLPSLRLASLFRPPQTRVQLLGLNTQYKATMPRLAPAAWDNYFFPLVCRVICCHWYRDMWERTLMIFALCSQRLVDARAHHIGFPRLRVHIDHFTNQFME